MKLELKDLPESPELLQKMVLDFQVEALFFKEKYFRLLEMVRLAKQQRFTPSSEKNILQMSLFDEAGITLPEEAKSNNDHEQLMIKGHARKKHPVRRPLPKDLPREIITHDISDAEKICECGTHLSRIGEEITEQLKYIPAKLSVVQHVRPKYACKPCQENVKIAAMPILLLPKSIATPELVAHTIVTKYCDHLPLYRQESIWQRSNIDLPRSSLCTWILKTAELCEPLTEIMQKEIVASGYASADETPVQVMDEAGRSNTQKSFMWCYRSHTDLPNIVFEYQETRGGHHAEFFLKGFIGYLQTDAYAGYHFAKRDENIISVGCMAHARRPFADLAKLSKQEGLAYEAMRYFQKLYAIESEARENHLSEKDRYLLRNIKAPPVLEAFQQWLFCNLTKVPRQHVMHKAIQYALTHWTQLTNYLKDGRVEIDNNKIENSIRPFALGRKNWMFAGSPSGAKAGAIFYSLIETCKANNIEPYQYFCTMLNKIRFCKTMDDYQKLLPQVIQI